LVESADSQFWIHSLLCFRLDYGYNPFTTLDSPDSDWFQVGGEAMGYSRTGKAKTHQRIVSVAAKRFREKGLTGIGIAELMKEAGLTVGGFYKHFESRDDLVAEALSSALETWRRRVDAAASGGPPFTYESLVDDYLSEAHRDHPGTGCPVAALAGDLARTGERTRAVITKLIREHIELLANLVRETSDEEKNAARSRAIMTYCVLVGAVSIARAVSDEQLSREILKTVAQALRNPAPETRNRKSA
jgi:TetR/AcrR family transcriptional regulator, transcriptional repressor for nem operon